KGVQRRPDRRLSGIATSAGERPDRYRDGLPDDVEGRMDFRSGPRSRRVCQYGETRGRRRRHQGGGHRRAVPRRQWFHQGVWHFRYLSAGAAAEDRAAQSGNDPQLYRRARDGLAAQLLGSPAMAIMKSEVSVASEEY